MKKNLVFINLFLSLALLSSNEFLSSIVLFVYYTIYTVLSIWYAAFIYFGIDGFHYQNSQYENILKQMNWVPQEQNLPVMNVPFTQGF